jgi:superfamily II DNA/RNA helicase
LDFSGASPAATGAKTEASAGAGTAAASACDENDRPNKELAWPHGTERRLRAAAARVASPTRKSAPADAVPSAGKRGAKAKTAVSEDPGDAAPFAPGRSRVKTKATLTAAPAEPRMAPRQTASAPAASRAGSTSGAAKATAKPRAAGASTAAKTRAAAPAKSATATQRKAAPGATSGTAAGRTRQASADDAGRTAKALASAASSSERSAQPRQARAAPPEAAGRAGRRKAEAATAKPAADERRRTSAANRPLVPAAIQAGSPIARTEAAPGGAPATRRQPVARGSEPAAQPQRPASRKTLRTDAAPAAEAGRKPRRGRATAPPAETALPAGEPAVAPEAVSPAEPGTVTSPTLPPLSTADEAAAPPEAAAPEEEAAAAGVPSTYQPSPEAAPAGQPALGTGLPEQRTAAAEASTLGLLATPAPAVQPALPVIVRPSPAEAAAPAVEPQATEPARPVFADLGLSEPVLRAINDMGYRHPTPVQEQAIPYVMMGRDVLGVAQTGTGKTASFTLPMLDILTGTRARARMPRSLILEPTRELALQVAENFVQYGKYLKLTHALVIGGESMADQKEILMRGVDVLIATPGRLIDMFERGAILLSDTRVLVIDEADRMLDMGFIPDVERIVSLVSRNRQTLFFSATMGPEIRRLADAFLRNPKEITVSRPATVATTITEGLALVAEHDKREALRRLIRTQNVQNALIFCNRKVDVDILYKSLSRHRFSVGALHGDMAQTVRFATLEKFRANELQLLVCSDVAARGLDIGGLSHVFNFDVPHHAEDYVHRIGRTGRAGLEGHAFTIAMPDDRFAVEAIEKLIGHPIPPINVEGLDPIDWSETDSRKRRGRRDPDQRKGGRDRGPQRTGSRPGSRRPRPGRAARPRRSRGEGARRGAASAQWPRGRNRQRPSRATRPARAGERTARAWRRTGGGTGSRPEP